MNKEKKTNSNPDFQDDFKGYSLEELKYQRALLAVKREFLKEKVIHQTKQVRERIPVLNGKTGIGAISSKGLLGKLAKGLNYTDYILLGFSIFSAGKKVFSLFHKRRKK